MIRWRQTYTGESPQKSSTNSLVTTMRKQPQVPQASDYNRTQYVLSNGASLQQNLLAKNSQAQKIHINMKNKKPSAQTKSLSSTQ